MFDIEAFRKRARELGQMHEEHRGAISAERAEGAALLALVAEAARPCLAAVSSKIEGTSRRGVRVSPWGIYLFEDGSWGTAGEREFSVASPDELVAEGYQAWQIVDALDKAIQAQLRGRKHEQTVAAQRAAGKMRAVANLLRSGS